MFAVNKIEETIDASQIQADKSIYLEYIINKLDYFLIMIESKFAEGVSEISQAINLFGVPTSKKCKIILLSMAKKVDSFDTQENLVASFGSLLKLLQSKILKELTLKDLLQIQKQKAAYIQPKSINIEKKYKTKKLLIDTHPSETFLHLIPFLIFSQLRTLPKITDNSDEKTVALEKDLIKELCVSIAILWHMALKNTSISENASLHGKDVLSDLISKIKSQKVLAAIKIAFIFLAIRFKAKFQDQIEGNRPHNGRISIQIVRNLIRKITIRMTQHFLPMFQS
jgi:hypothetical protein